MPKIKKINFTSQLSSVYNRLRFIRSLSSLTRDEIEERHSIPESTLRKWETGRIPLTEKGLNRCLEMYKKIGIIASRKWVLEGIGPRPYLSIEFGEKEEFNDLIINHFKSVYNNCIVFKVTDETMLPKYSTGDIVVGNIYAGDLKDLHNTDCIILLENDDLLLRRFVYTDSTNYTLMNTNIKEAKYPLLINTDIKYIAPVIWIKLSSNK